MKQKAIIVQQNDFGGAGTVLIGVCKRVDPDLESYVNSSLPKFNIEAAAASLRSSIRYWPDNTVFVSVVDPGVGTDRKASVAKLTTGGYIVTPDNGTLTLQLEDGLISEIREIDQNVNRLKNSGESDIFHGRDVFAYCAARLAAGIIDFEGVGPAYPIENIVTFQKTYGAVDENGASGVIAEIMHPFGNLETNIRVSDFEKSGIQEGTEVQICLQKDGEVKFDQKVLYHKSFGYAQPGQEIFYNSCNGYMGLGLNKASFASQYGIDDSGDWTISVRRI